MHRSSGRRHSVAVLVTFISAVAAALFLVPAAFANTPVSGAVFTTVNPVVDGTGHCLNGGPGADAGLVDCNIYDGKQFVWLSGGPNGNQPALVDGTYVFAVLVPGGQNGDPNDGTELNLSDVSPTSNTGAGDDWTNRVFTVTDGVISYNGTHDFANNKIRLMGYDDTTNPGGEYILAVCNLADADQSAANQPGVDPSDCKYDAFKVKEPNTPPAEDLQVSKTAVTSYDLKYVWNIAKSVDKTEIDIADGGKATFNYTVVVSHDGGTQSNWKVTGQITVFNPNTFDVSGVDVADAIDNNGSCAVTDGTGVTVPGKQSVVLDYTCTYAASPDPPSGTNTATATWFEGSLLHASGTAGYNFAGATVNAIDECIAVNDSLGGALGAVCVGDPNPTSFTYPIAFSGDPAGTCTSHNNTATFTTNDTGTTSSAGQSVKVCVGADLKVSKTAATSFTRTYKWSILKLVDKTRLDPGGTATYSVAVTETGYVDSAWNLHGTITVSNPNDWEDIVASVSDPFCGSAASTVTVPAGKSVDVNYGCDRPNGSSGTNTATATWDKAAASTPDGSASGTADFAFTTPTTTVNKTITVVDPTFGLTLGTLTATDPPTTPASKTFTFTHTFTPPASGCVTVTNTATIQETGQSSSVSLQNCNSGALTMGFWQNKNGQGIISGGASTGGVCNSATWLRNYAPFQDLSSTAKCSDVATYVYNIVKAANASGSSMNAMLKAQMLATALDVYFSDPALGGNKISAPAPIGGLLIDLTHICKMVDSSSGGTCSGTTQNVSSAFGGATSLTVLQILSYAAGQSNAGGSVWYGQVKTTQEMAKNTFDAINNQIVSGP